MAAKGQNPKRRFDRSDMEKAAFPAAFSSPVAIALLAEVIPPVFTAEHGAGDTDKAIAAGIFFAAERVGGNCRRRADRAADDSGRNVRRPEAAVIVPTVIAVAPRTIPIAVIAIRLIAIGLPLIAAGIGTTRSPILAVGVRIELRAIAGIVDDFLRYRGAREHGGKGRRRRENS